MYESVYEYENEFQGESEWGWETNANIESQKW